MTGAGTGEGGALLVDKVLVEATTPEVLEVATEDMSDFSTSKIVTAK